MQSKLRLFPLTAVVLVVAACGGGGSPTFVGPIYTVTDGHVSGATVICQVDPNSDSAASPNFAAIAPSDANGRVQFSQACNGQTVASGGTNPDGLRFIGRLRAPANAIMLTPLTTLMTGPNALTEAQVIALMDLPAGTKLLTTDPGSDTEVLLQAKSVAVHQLLLQVTTTLAKLGGLDVSMTASVADVAKLQPVYDAVKDALVQTLKDTTLPPPMGVTGAFATVNSAFVNTFIQSAATAVRLTDSNIQTGVDKVGASNLASTMSVALTSQVNALLGATGSGYALATVITNMQSNTGIPDAIAAAVNGGTLTTATTGTGLTDVSTVVNSAGTSTTLAGTTTTSTSTSSTATSTSTTSSTTTTSTTSTTLPVNYLYLTSDTISYNDGTGAPATAYTLADFHSAAGILVKWPMAASAALEFKLAASGTFVAPTGPVTAALAMTDTSATGKGQIRAYIDNVNVSSSSSGVTFSVPASAHAWVYAMAPDGSEIKGNFADTVAGVTNALTYGSTSSITLGSVVNNATQRLGALNDLSGKYRVTLVVNGLSLALADGSAMTNYTVEVPAANGANKSVSGVGIEGYMTVVNPNPTTTSTTSTTTVSSTTTTTVSPTNFAYLAGDAIGFDNGTGATSYTLSQFQASPGITVKWPMASTAAFSFTLTDGGTFNLGGGQTTSAAIEITDTATGGQALLKAYIDSVNLTQSGANVLVSVPTTAFARIYARGTDGSEILSGFADAVAGVNNTLVLGGSSSIVVGNVVSNAMARLGTGTTLVGKTYSVKLVLSNSPLRLTSGAAFTTDTVTVPGSMSGTGAAVSVTGPSLTGFINLIP
ncbi:MAG: hypothetical protein PHH58_02230 [Rhodoferax sp.]|nr:hypothetical protein [Rhodoferax sp.]